MIQDIQPHQYHNEYTPVPPVQDDIVFCYEGRTVCTKEDRTFFHVSDFKEDTELQYLFGIDSIHFYLSYDIPENAYRMPIADVRRYDPQYLGFAAVTGWQLFNWYNDNRFCGRCGKPMVHDSVERAMRCSCGNIIYPKIMPAVITGVINDKGQIALTRYATGYTTYALVAGFSEIGETVEETVIREVKEEIGVDVDPERIEFYKSQPWSFSSTLLFGFYCHVKGNDEIHLDRNELKEGKWFYPHEIPTNTYAESLTEEMLARFARGEVQ